MHCLLHGLEFIVFPFIRMVTTLIWEPSVPYCLIQLEKDMIYTSPKRIRKWRQLNRPELELNLPITLYINQNLKKKKKMTILTSWIQYKINFFHLKNDCIRKDFFYCTKITSKTFRTILVIFSIPFYFLSSIRKRNDIFSILTQAISGNL